MRRTGKSVLGVWIAGLCLAACGNGDSEKLDLFVSFPDQASLDATESLQVQAIDPAEGSTCEALLGGTASPDDPGYPVEKELENPLSASQDAWKLSGVGPGRRLFYARAKDAGGMVLLHGCTDLTVEGGGQVDIDLQAVEECGQDSDCDDQNDCTADSCNQGACSHQALATGTPCDAGSGDLCQATCDELGGCTGAPVECDDGMFCNGTESCDPQDGQCLAGTNQPAADYCQEDRLVTCDGSGVQTGQDQCEFGCNADADPDRCLRLAPSNFNPSLLCANPYDLVVSAPVEIDTDAGTITGVDAQNIVFTVVDQGTDLPAVGVFSFNSVVILSSVTVVGTNALALLSCNEVSIEDEVDLCAQGQFGGPGGQNGGRRERDGLGYQSGQGLAGLTSVQPPASSGGGGAAFGAPGGAGGSDPAENVLGGAGGQSYGAESGLVPLLGGSGGGGGGGANDGGFGGGGGGALQISAGGVLTLDSGGGINACGAGGGAAAIGGGGGGGGSGGSLLLEATSIVNNGTLAANGGGGGGGWGEIDTPVAQGGQAGQLSYSAAHGGAAGGDGGAGASGGAASSPGGQTAVSNTTAGGGGGAAGRIQLNTRSGQVEGDGTISPNASLAVINTY